MQDSTLFEWLSRCNNRECRNPYTRIPDVTLCTVNPPAGEYITSDGSWTAALTLTPVSTHVCNRPSCVLSNAKLTSYLVNVSVCFSILSCARKNNLEDNARRLAPSKQLDHPNVVWLRAKLIIANANAIKPGRMPDGVQEIEALG